MFRLSNGGSNNLISCAVRKQRMQSRMWDYGMAHHGNIRSHGEQNQTRTIFTNHFLNRLLCIQGKKWNCSMFAIENFLSSPIFKTWPRAHNDSVRNKSQTCHLFEYYIEIWNITVNCCVVYCQPRHFLLLPFFCQVSRRGTWSCGWTTERWNRRLASQPRLTGSWTQ